MKALRLFNVILKPRQGHLSSKMATILLDSFEGKEGIRKTDKITFIVHVQLTTNSNKWHRIPVCQSM